MNGDLYGAYSIAEDLLHSMGYEVDRGNSDEEAIEKAARRTDNAPYPAHFSKSETSEKKSFEEFYIEGEAVNMDRFTSLGGA